MFAFRFELRPLPEVTPWGGDRPRLHWFGLTEGRYRWEVAGRCLPRPVPGSSEPGIDHYVARLWEDVLDLTPTVLEPVPDDLRTFVASDPATWAPVDGDDGDDSDDAVEARSWHALHRLDLAYLADPPRLRLWRTVGTRDEVHVRWTHPRGEPDEPGGAAVVDTAAYVDAVHDLGRTLMTAMRARVDEVRERGGLPGVEIDLDALAREQEERAAHAAAVRLDTPPGTDWDAVRRGARALLGARPPSAAG